MLAPPQGFLTTVQVGGDLGATANGACHPGLQFQAGENAETYGLDGNEKYTITGIGELKPRQDVTVQVTRDDGKEFSFTARCRIDTYNELEYFRSGGILHYVLRRLAAA